MLGSKAEANRDAKHVRSSKKAVSKMEKTRYERNVSPWRDLWIRQGIELVNINRAVSNEITGAVNEVLLLL